MNVFGDFIGTFVCWFSFSTRQQQQKKKRRERFGILPSIRHKAFWEFESSLCSAVLLCLKKLPTMP